MVRVVLFTVVLALIGCAGASSSHARRSAVDAVTLVADGFIGAAATESVKHVYLRVSGANSQEVDERVQRAGGKVTLFVGDHKCEVRDGRLREKRSDEPCYSIELEVRDVSDDSVTIRAVWLSSFGGVQVITFHVKQQNRKWVIAEERVGLIS